MLERSASAARHNSLSKPMVAALLLFFAMLLVPSV
jgi:hypothetical protein